MAEPVLDPTYWAGRLRKAEGSNLHHAVFRCPIDKWERIEEAHRKILATTIQPTDSIVDAGCGWGRLLDLLPPHWFGLYHGIDLSPEFIHKALIETVPRIIARGQCGAFSVADLRDLTGFNRYIPKGKFDIAILVSIRPMIRRNCGDDVWSTIEQELRRVAKRLLFLEYDETDGGRIE